MRQFADLSVHPVPEASRSRLVKDRRIGRSDKQMVGASIVISLPLADHGSLC
jgi:hypothetical protein